MPYAPDVRRSYAGRSGEFRKNAPGIGFKIDTTLIRRLKVQLGRKKSLFLSTETPFVVLSLSRAGFIRLPSQKNHRIYRILLPIGLYSLHRTSNEPAGSLS